MPANHQSQAPETAMMDIPVIGRDEMNLAEFPLSVLTDRASEAVKTLVFQNQHGTLTITSSDAYGLPTAQDADVLVALIQLTKQKNDFKEPTVNFTRYELLRLLGWPNEGKSYRRLNESLNRWHGVSLTYEGCWWDNRAKRYGNAKIHIIESVVILEGSAKTTHDSMQQSLPLSSFEWNKKFIQSCQADNLKYLDLSLYFSLTHPSSKRLYRFLDKRFYLRPEWIFDLTEIAFERVGLGRNYADAGKIKEKLTPAIEELEGKNFLQPMTRAERYFKDGKVWKIRFTHKAPALASPAPPAAEPDPPLVAELVKRGVTRATALHLVQRHPAETIQAKIDVFDWMMEKQDKRIEKSPAGYLVQSIDKDYAIPKGFTSRAEWQKQEEARQAREREAAEQRRREKAEADRKKADRQKINDYRKSLTAEQLHQLEADALAHADAESKESHDSSHGDFKRMMRDMITDEYILTLIAAQATTAPA